MVKLLINTTRKTKNIRIIKFCPKIKDLKGCKIGNRGFVLKRGELIT